VLSSNTLNGHSTLVMVCLITNTNKTHQFHIELDGRTKTTGVILCDQVKMLGIAAINAKFQEKCPEDVWKQARDLFLSIGLDCR
jgi:mRNA interferase MazF